MPGYATRRWRTVRSALFLLAMLPAAAGAQNPTGTLTGQVTDTQGAGIPNVTIVAESPALQGTQRTVTSATGAFILKFLPPGLYTVTFQIQGFAPATRTRTIAATEPVTLNVELSPSQLRESVTVTADSPTFVNTVESAASVRHSLLGSLPNDRNVRDAVDLAPGVYASGPNREFVISGGMSYDNLFLVNGVTVQDNLRGNPLDLFIEDAIQETTIASSGVSAEYGRFAGGLINVLTRSGSNMVSGSFRASFKNDNWRTVSPFGETKVDATIPTYEATVGGPIARDRLWLFAAARAYDSTQSRETGVTRIPFERTTNEQRYEIKGTTRFGIGHRLTVNYLGIERADGNSAWPSIASVMDLASLMNPRTPQRLFGAHYAGAFGSRLFLEAQYSARTFAIEESGGLDRDRIAGTPLQSQEGMWWWAPAFCGVCPAEERNNDDLMLKGSYFLSTGTGAHDMVFGYDGFNDKAFVNNNQSGSDYWLITTASVVENGVVYPIIEPDFSTQLAYFPIQQPATPTSFRTHSLFFNDKWAVNRRLSLNLGVRYEKHDGRDSSGALVSNDASFSPRFGLTWDPSGSGLTNISFSAGRYVAGLNNLIAGSASPAGTPSTFVYAYEGDPINTDGGPLVPTDEALRRVFEWFDTTANPQVLFIDIPGVSTKIEGTLESPHADEITVGFGRQLGSRASIRVDFVNRVFGGFYARRADTSTGIVFDEVGQPYDLKLIENTDDFTRRYRGLNVQASFRTADLTTGLSYTLSRLWGNFDGENIGTGPATGTLTAYPEYRDARWYAPEGDLSADQRHRARAWANYRLPWARSVADISLSAAQSFQTGTPYGAVGEVNVDNFVDNPGYVQPPLTNLYYFTARDAFRTATSYRTDLAVNLSRRIAGNRSPEAFAQFQLLNLFNQFQAFRNTANEINTTVQTAFTSRSLRVFDPFTEAPVEGVHWRKGASFGTPQSRNAYTLPRTFSFSVGVKF